MTGRTWKVGFRRDRRMIMEQLEERIVMDAAVEPIPHSDPFHAGNNPHLSDPMGAADPESGPEEPAMELQGQRVSFSSAVPGISGVFDGDLDVLLVSDALTGANQIANAAEPNTKIVYYRAAQDDLDSINGMLSDLTERAGKKIAHLAVASHGEDGILGLGPKSLDLDAAIAHRTSFKDMASNLEPHAQIQLYSCSLASSERGQLLAHAIAAMTGADVFASTDVTGAKPHNWVLEYATYPTAEMVSILDIHKLEQVPGQLGQVPVTHLATSDPASTASNQLIASGHGDGDAVPLAIADLGLESNAHGLSIRHHTLETMR